MKYLRLNYITSKIFLLTRFLLLITTMFTFDLILVIEDIFLVDSAEIQVKWVISVNRIEVILLKEFTVILMTLKTHLYPADCKEKHTQPMFHFLCRIL